MRPRPSHVLFHLSSDPEEEIYPFLVHQRRHWFDIGEVIRFLVNKVLNVGVVELVEYDKFLVIVRHSHIVRAPRKLVDRPWSVLGATTRVFWKGWIIRDGICDCEVYWDYRLKSIPSSCGKWFKLGSGHT